MKVSRKKFKVAAISCEKESLAFFKAYGEYDYAVRLYVENKNDPFLKGHYIEKEQATLTKLMTLNKAFERKFGERFCSTPESLFEGGQLLEQIGAIA